MKAKNNLLQSIFARQMVERRLHRLEVQERV